MFFRTDSGPYFLLFGYLLYFKSLSGGWVKYGEAERRTLLNLIEAADHDQVLLSSRKDAHTIAAKSRLWPQILESFNEITGREGTLLKLRTLLKNLKAGRNKTAKNICNGKKYLEFDEALGKWMFHN